MQGSILVLLVCAFAAATFLAAIAFWFSKRARNANVSAVRETKVAQGFADKARSQASRVVHAEQAKKNASAIGTAPLAFAVNNLRDIHDAERRLDSEKVVFAEIGRVLKAHGLEQKYGLTLLHKHFDIGEDEMMVEYTDLKTRTLTSKPAKIGSIPTTNLLEVTWSLGEDLTRAMCVWRCYYDQNSSPQHVGQHRGG